MVSLAVQVIYRPHLSGFTVKLRCGSVINRPFKGIIYSFKMMKVNNLRRQVVSREIKLIDRLNVLSLSGVNLLIL